MKRVFIIVLDSLGIGAMPDAESFGDSNPNTLMRISASPEFKCENLRKMGLFNIEGLTALGGVKEPTAAVFKMAEKSRGKDTTTGHWEIAGIVSDSPMPTYPEGFPDEIIREFSEKTGRGVLCNKPYSGTQVISDYGERHIETGDLIVYTSADSVFQIAAHEDVVAPETLYEYCRIARKILCGKHAVGRVIARPFTGSAPAFTRTANRRDFSLEPQKNTLLDAVKKSGKSVIAVGKISDIFAGRGITCARLTHGNGEGMAEALKCLEESFEGLCFVNLVDFDMLYGHRQDIDGYAAAFAEFDKWLAGFTANMQDDDMLMITADHGCDPGDDSTDHTREYTPLIIYGKSIKAGYFGRRETFADIAATAAHWLEIPQSFEGESLVPQILKER